eukprot:m51a1_g4697 hypothetical protein (173) ;mRNA; r:218463-219112
MMRHVRFHVLAALLVVVAAAVGLSTGLIGRLAQNELHSLESSQADEEAALFFGAFSNQLSVIGTAASLIACWDLMYEYMAAQDPEGEFWKVSLGNGTDMLTGLGLQGYMLVLPNGTMMNGIMWNAEGNASTIPPAVLGQQVGAALVQKGEASGLYWIQETSVEFPSSAGTRL